MTRIFTLLLAGATIFSGCSGSSGQGGETQVCYPNDTCNAGLACLSHLCVRPSDAGSVGGGSGGGGSTGGGAGGGAVGGGGGGGNGGGGGAAGGSGGGSGGGGSSGDGGSTIGVACANSSPCTGPGESCSTTAFGADPINPASSGSCVSLSCTTSGNPSFPFGCGVDAGACVGVGTGSACVGRCSFRSGEAAVGCVGSATCQYLDFYIDGFGGPTGYGYCLGGCSATTACPSGSSCQLETGRCVASLRTFTKSFGDACQTSANECNCLPPKLGTASYCSTTCMLGSACPSGYTCEAGLIVGVGANFSSNPTGVAGACMKNCSSDADCAAISSHCDPQPAGAKVCIPGPR